ncbi:Alpha-tocopherol transfer protein [Papilio machaon]|uniref:Alpha-tocopherol transfer protein n=1 Tax=Papilio machaon TaxID=76193 RepID=A0A194R247_PAPMA|nr:Alpha-tocopherol transfer protein [Papilio machaon]
MNTIPKNYLLNFNEDTLVSIRKEYDLDKPGRIDEAIDLLMEWLKKQDHFVKKEFPRDYLERKIIFSKGSVERAKVKLDRNCTLKTFMPSFYTRINFKHDYKESETIIDAVLPKLTDDHYRCYALKNIGKRFDNGFTNYFRFTLSMVEYITAHDYCKGLIAILDYRETNLIEMVKNIDITELRQFITLLTVSYGMKIKGLHIIHASKAIDTLVAILKQCVSAKIGQRIQVHKDMKSLHKFVQKDVLPTELGGDEKSLIELHDNWLNVLSSEGFQEYFDNVREATTNEIYRQTDKFNNDYMGIAGTFRTFTVD